MTADEVFFREWRARRAGEKRSLDRARLLAEALGILGPGVPVLSVVGSKGKGTAATYASAYLTAAGLRVCTVTSPGHRTNRDRIRVNGRAASESDLNALAERLGEAMDGLPPTTGGYLSPAGLFTLAGVLHSGLTGAGALVLEAGMGGRSDEISLFAPTVVAITPIFAEHLGVLGDTLGDIAAEKAGVVDPATRAVVSVPQSKEVTAAVAGTIGEAPAVEGVEDGAPAGLLPQGLGRTSAELGWTAARRMLEVTGVPRPPAERVRAVMSSISLPGRLSWHRLPGTSTEVLADSAIDRAGVAAALTAARARWGAVDHVLVCLPDHKDLAGAVTELGGLPVTFVRLPYEHLRFTHPLPPAWTVIDAEDLSPAFLAELGGHVVALGTVYFIGRVLDLVDADTERLFTPPSG